LVPIGAWNPDSQTPVFSSEDLIKVIPNVRQPVHIIRNGHGTQLGLGQSGQVLPINNSSDSNYLLMATLPALYPEWLGDRSFLEVHSLRFPYVAGAMFHGIASTDMVIAMARSGMIGFFGAGGLPIDVVENAILKIQSALGDAGLSFGSNLIHSPQEPALEEAVVDLYLRHGVTRVSAAAFMTLSPNVVKYASTGLQEDSSGQIHRRNYIFAKLSRPEVAKMFMSPAPQSILDLLVSQGKITKMEATLAAKIPVAEDITVEADSGGHTDNRPLPAIFPTVLSLRDEVTARYGYTSPIRVGAAGGLGTPSAVAAAFSMGAAYVLTGSVNQSAKEAGLSLEARKMLGEAKVTDVTMAPAADMFELGVKVQALKHGTMFCNRASLLYQIYKTCDCLEAIPDSHKVRLEKEVFQAPIQQIWSDTKDYFSRQNPKEIEKAEKDPKHLMALVFRWYLGNSAGWAIKGNPERRIDYQICCGPSMGAFNAWVKDSYLDDVENRSVADIALNLMEGAAVITRAQQLRSYGVPVPGCSFDFRPRPLS
jgi:PfaD family protein